MRWVYRSVLCSACGATPGSGCLNERNPPLQPYDRAPDDDRLMRLVDSALAQPPGRAGRVSSPRVRRRLAIIRAGHRLRRVGRVHGWIPHATILFSGLIDPTLEPDELLEGRFRIVPRSVKEAWPRF